MRRWLCKWCGFYDGTDGRFWAVMDGRTGVWALPYEVTPRMLRDGTATTPQKQAKNPKAPRFPNPYSPFAE